MCSYLEEWTTGSGCGVVAIVLNNKHTTSIGRLHIYIANPSNTPKVMYLYGTTTYSTGAKHNSFSFTVIRYCAASHFLNSKNIIIWLYFVFLYVFILFLHIKFSYCIAHAYTLYKTPESALCSADPVMDDMELPHSHSQFLFHHLVSRYNCLRNQCCWTGSREPILRLK